MLIQDVVREIYATVGEMIDRRIAAHVAEYHPQRNPEAGRVQEMTASPHRTWVVKQGPSPEQGS